MKKILLIATLFFTALLCALAPHIAQHKTQQAMLAVVIMVKNEAHAIEATLQPFVAAGVKHFLIFDTGSTDATVAVAKRFFKEKKILHAHIMQEKFIDYATSRNQALECAEELFPDIPFFIMPDAEWVLHGAEHLLTFCAQEKNTVHAAYFMRICMPKSMVALPRLIRTASHARFSGAVHELLEVGACPAVPPELYFAFNPSPRGAAATHKRLHSDLALLLRDHIADPHNTRTLFFIAQTYENLNKFKQAYHYYTTCLAEQRALQDTPSWNKSQAYEAAYNAGLNAERLMQDQGQDGGSCSWPQIFELYKQAHALDPLRAEPLLRIAFYYWRNNELEACFIYCKQAAAITFPHHVVDNIEVDVYTHQCYELLGACAAHLEDYDTSIWAFEQAVQARPDIASLQKNLALAREKKEKK